MKVRTTFFSLTIAILGIPSCLKQVSSLDQFPHDQSRSLNIFVRENFCRNSPYELQFKLRGEETEILNCKNVGRKDCFDPHLSRRVYVRRHCKLKCKKFRKNKTCPCKDTIGRFKFNGKWDFCTRKSIRQKCHLEKIKRTCPQSCNICPDSPSTSPSNQPSMKPSNQPSMKPSGQPSTIPSDQPSDQPSMKPSDQPSTIPSDQPSDQPSMKPSNQPSTIPSDQPSTSDKPSMKPSDQPSTIPSNQPSDQPSNSNAPSDAPTKKWFQLGDDIDGLAADDYSGASVSLSNDGQRVAIGASRNDGIGGNSGHVRVFQFDGNNWGQLGDDINGEAAGDESGQSVSLSADGRIVAIGAFLNAGNGGSSGHVRVFELDGNNWVQLGLDIDGEAAGDNSGGSVSLSADGQRVAIGASRNDGIGDNSGHVKVLELDGNRWVQLEDDIDGEEDCDYSGHSVSLSADGQRVAIGAKYNDGNGDNSGHVRVFQLDGNNREKLGDDINGEAAVDYSGWSVSLSANGQRVAIGAYGNAGNGFYSGHVRVFELDGNNWVQLGLDINGEAAVDTSGESVSLSADGQRVAIGATGNDGNGDNSGHVRVFELDGNNWVQLGLDIDGEEEEDNSGHSVSLSADGQRVAIGAIENDGNGDNSGHVRVFEFA